VSLSLGPLIMIVMDHIESDIELSYIPSKDETWC